MLEKAERRDAARELSTEEVARVDDYDNALSGSEFSGNPNEERVIDDLLAMVDKLRGEPHDRP